MKIAILSESAFPIINGVSVSTDILATGLTKIGHEVLLICPNNNIANQDKIKVYKIARTPSISLYKEYPLPSFNKKYIYNLLNEFKPDIVHSQIPFIYGKIAQNWSKSNKIPFVTVNHTFYIDYLHYAGFFKPLIKSPFIVYLRNFYNSSDLVITPSQFMKNQLISYGINQKIEIIPTGINIPSDENVELTLEIKDKLQISPNDSVIIYLSRIAKEKNIYMLIDAFNLLFKEIKSIKLLMCGAGPELKNLILYKDTLECRDNIILTGMIKKEDVNNYLYCGNIFAFPSYTETQGLAIMEAMACGLAVVAVNKGGVPESINNNINGLLCNVSAYDMKNKLKELLINESFCQNIQKQAQIKSKEFSIDNMINKYNNIYNSLI